jgi:putative restriction endonuclease
VQDISTATSSAIANVDAGRPAPRLPAVIDRLVRNTAAAQRVKALHASECQVCGLTILTPGGAYAEGGHIRPLGRPHNGPDTESNILCLCPNDHVRLDAGAILISNSMQILDAVDGREIGRLRTIKDHPLDVDCLGYHRQLYGPDAK